MCRPMQCCCATIGVRCCAGPLWRLRQPHCRRACVGALSQLSALALVAEYVDELVATVARLPRLQLLSLTQRCDSTSLSSALSAARTLAAAPALRGAHLGVSAYGGARDSWAELGSLEALCMDRARALSLDLDAIKSKTEADHKSDVEAALRPWGGAARMRVIFWGSCRLEGTMLEGHTRDLGLLLSLSPRLVELLVGQIALTDGLAATLSGLTELAAVNIAGICATNSAAGALAALRLRSATSCDAALAVGQTGGLPSAPVLRAMRGLRRLRLRSIWECSHANDFARALASLSALTSLALGGASACGSASQVADGVVVRSNVRSTDPTCVDALVCAITQHEALTATLQHLDLGDLLLPPSATAALARALGTCDLRALREAALMVDPSVPDGTLIVITRALSALPSLCGLRFHLGTRMVNSAEPFLDLARACYSLQRLVVEAGAKEFSERCKCMLEQGGWAAGTGPLDKGELKRAREVVMNEEALRGIDIGLLQGGQRHWLALRVL